MGCIGLFVDVYTHKIHMTQNLPSHINLEDVFKNVVL